MVRVVVDTRRLRREIATSREFARWLGWKMEPVLDYARNTAPDAPPIGEGYKKELTLVFGINEHGEACARVVGMHYTSNWVEFGAHAGGKTPVLRYRILGNALQHVRRT